MNGESAIRRVMAGELLKQRRTRSFLVVPAAVCVLAAVVYFGVETGARSNWFGIPSGFFVAASTVGWLAGVLVLVAVVSTSFLISREFATGAVKSAWVRPLGRQAWYLGRVLYSCAVLTVLFVLAVLVIAALSAARVGFVDLMEKDYLIHTAAGMGRCLALTAVLTLIVFWSAVVVTSAFAVLINHPGGTIAVVIGVGVAMTALAVFAPLRPFLLTTYVGLPSEQMVAMSKGLPLPLEWKDLVWRTLAAAGGWAGLAWIAGRTIISKKEIKG